MYSEYKKIRTILSDKLFRYFEDMVNNFGHRKPPFEMQPIITYLLNSTYIMFCGALENKLKTLKFFLALIDLNARREFFEKGNKSVYNEEALKEIYNTIEKMGVDKGKMNNKGVEEILDDLHKKYNEDIVKTIEDTLNNTELLNCCRAEFDIFNEYFRTLEKKQLKEIYENAWQKRHRIAHNLYFLYDNQFDLMKSHDDVVKKNYFVEIGIMQCIDNYIVDAIKKMFDLRIYI